MYENIVQKDMNKFKDNIFANGISLWFSNLKPIEFQF